MEDYRQPCVITCCKTNRNPAFKTANYCGINGKSMYFNGINVISAFTCRGESSALVNTDKQICDIDQ